MKQIYWILLFFVCPPLWLILVACDVLRQIMKVWAYGIAMYLGLYLTILAMMLVCRAI